VLISLTAVSRSFSASRRICSEVGFSGTATIMPQAGGERDPCESETETLSNTIEHYGRLTTAVHKPSIVIEQATSSYSFRSPELSQPI
jgi:hypothetical protein